VLFEVGPAVGEEDLAGLRVDIGEGVEDVGEFVDGEVLRVVVSAVDCLRVGLVCVLYGGGGGGGAPSSRSRRLRCS
jgi:hypothetical protein